MGGWWGDGWGDGWGMVVDGGRMVGIGVWRLLVSSGVAEYW